MHEADPACHTGCDPDGPVRPGRDDPVDVPRAREPVDRVLVLGRQDRPLVREGEPDRLGVAVDRDHEDVLSGPRRLQQPELRGAGP